MSAGRRLARTFAVTATLLMLLMVADSSVVKIASSEPVVSPAAYANNNTTPPPPPPPPVPPPDEPQRPVEPGTVTQGWDNSTFAPTPIHEHGQPTMRDSENETVVETAYGNFALNKSSPHFVRVLSSGPNPQEIAESAFLVMFLGQLLSPGDGAIDNATPYELSFHYGLYLNASLQGTLSVDYRFRDETNNITISFSPSIGLPTAYQIVWLTFTTWDAVDTAAYPGGTERFDNITQGYGLLSFGQMGTLYGTGGYTRDGIPGAAIRPDKVGSDGLSLQMDVSDAVSDYGTSYVGKLTLGGHSGNAVLTTFAAGHLTIDPQLVMNGSQQDATASSGIQRKTFYDGKRYWIFWKDKGLNNRDAIKYKTSLDGKNWNPSAGIVLVEVVVGGDLTFGFAVANSGNTVVVVWVDGASKTYFNVKSGLIAEDGILWDGVNSYATSGGYYISEPVSVALTASGRMLGVAYTVSAQGYEVGAFDWFLCSPRTSGFSGCAVQTSIGINSAVSAYNVVISTNFNGDVLAVFGVSPYNSGHSLFTGYLYTSSSSTRGCSSYGVDLTVPFSPDWINHGLFTAATSGLPNLLLLDTSSGQVHGYNMDGSCNLAEDSMLVGGAISPGTNAEFLTMGTEQDGLALYLFYMAGASPNRHIYYTRIVPNKSLTGPTSITFLASYTEPWYVNAAPTSSDFIPLAFTRQGGVSGDGCTGSNWCLFYINYPLPLNGEAAINNPWATKLGAPLVSEVGGVVSPTTGLLANGQTLIAGMPGLPIIYREPGLYYLNGTTDTIYSSTAGYPVVMSGSVTMPGMYYDLPWIDGMVHLQGGQQFPLYQTGTSGSVSWFNNTRGIRYTLKYDGTYTLTYPSGAYIQFTANLYTLTYTVYRAYLDSTGSNYATYGYTSGVLSSVTDSSTPGRQIVISSGQVSYGNGQIIKLNDLGPPASWGISNSCSDTGSQSRGLRVVDAVGRATNYYVCGYKLIRLDSPNGGRVDYAYATSSNPDTRVWQGTDVYSLPLLKMDIYNESGAGLKARSLAFNWNFQNGEVVRALVNTTDKSAVVKGANEYIFNSAAGTASVSVHDSTGQVLYYDMETCTASPCGSNPMKDLSGNVNSGTLGGSGYTFPPGKYGKAINLAGAAWIQAVDSNSLDATRVTLSAWINPSSITGTKRIISKWGDTSGEKSYLLSMGDSGTNGKIRFSVYDGATTVNVDSATAVSTLAWWHVAGTYDGQTATVYINGARSNSASITIAIQVTTTPVRIGDEGDGSGAYKFQGTIDEIHIFNRGLSSEDIGILYSRNALKRGEEQNWYSINDQPHLAEGFVGDETTASVVTQDAIDDWGNQIYHRDALGNETFASYANTNQQNHFYAPGRLTKNVGNPGTFSTKFIDFSNGQFPTGDGNWVVTGPANPATQIDYGTFDKISPSLKINAAGSGGDTLVTYSLVASPNFVEFRARVSADTGATMYVQFGSVLGKFMGVELSGGVIYFWNQVNWVTCNYRTTGTVPLYSKNEWHRFTFDIDLDYGSEYPWKSYVDGIETDCNFNLGGHDLQTMYIQVLQNSALSGWIDDIKTYRNFNDGQLGYDSLNIGFSGLQPRQSIRLLAENGTVIDQTMQTGTGALWLSFNSALTGLANYYENGDNAKTVVQIYAEDGTLEYQSPLTRFFVGEHYTYTRPRAFFDELVKTKSGALYWSSTYADEPGFCTAPITCTPSDFIWRQANIAGATTASAVSGNYIHATPFDYGTRWHYFIQAQQSAPTYFVTYVKIPEGKTPDGIALSVGEYIAGFCDVQPCWRTAFWGAAPSVAPSGNSQTNYYMGMLPAIRGQWIQLMLKSSEFLTTGTWVGFAYGANGGEAEWDATTNQTGASLTVSNLPSGVTVGVYYAINGTLIATGTESSGTANVLLYNKARGIDLFPLNANIKIYDANNEYYFGPARNIWPGDTFRYVGASSFFDSKSGGISYWPSSSIHTTLLGSKKFSGDCLSAILCYDMETMTETTTSVATGAVTVQMLDLSGKGSHGTIGGVPKTTSADIAKAAAGLGTTFATGGSDEIAFTMPTIDTTSGHWNTVSFWMYWNGQTAGGQIPFGFTNYNLLFPGTGYPYFGFNTANTNGDLWGIDNTGLANTLVYVTAEFYNQGTTNSKLYINGVLKTLTQKSGTQLSRTATTTAKLSGWPNDNQYKFGGTIDQVQVFNRALTDTEVLAQYYSRMPGAPQTYLRPQTNGLPVTSRVPYEGTYLYVAATYDSKGNVLSVTDAGRTISGGANITRYAYSSLYGRDYRTQVNRSDGKQIYTAYDFQSGVTYGTLGIDCRRSRTSYDAIGRPTQTSVYDIDGTEVLHLDMETATYNSLKDVSCAGTPDSRNGDAVTLTGTTATTGPDGGARSFNGASDNIEVAHSATISLSNPITVSFWAKWFSFPPGDGTCGAGASSAIPINKALSSSDYKGSWWFELRNNGQLDFYLTFPGPVYVPFSSLGIQSLNRMYHYAATYDGQNVKLYRDGLLLSTTPETRTLQTTTGSLYVGKGFGTGCGSKYTNAVIDDVRLFNVARIAPDIASLWGFKYKLLTSSAAAYDDVFPTSVTTYDGVSTPRALYFDMGESYQAANGYWYMEDKSGHGQDGQLYGTLSSVPGKIGNARSFNQTTSDRIQAPNINVGTSFSVSLWVNPTTGQTDAEGVLVKEDYAFSVMLTSTRFVKAYLYNGASWQPLGSNSSLPAGQWSHVVVTYAQVGANTAVYIYVNGGLSGGNAGVLTGNVASSTNPVMFGALASAIQRIYGSEDEAHIIKCALSAIDVTNIYTGVEKSHMSRTYQDGLGRTTRSVVMDMLGTKIQTVATLGWNDQPIYSYLPSGQYSTFTYDFLGRTLSVQTPGDSTIFGISRTIVSEKARMIESIDAVGRKSYIKTDLLGRTIETAVWNVSSLAYGNRTATTYNALSEVTTSQDAKLQTTTIYYNSLGKPKMTVFPDSTDAAKRYSVVYYDDNLRAFETVDVMGRAAVSSYDSIGRVNSVKLKPTISTDCAPNPCVVTYGYDSVHDDLQTIDNGTAKITRLYDSLHRMTQETLQIPPSGSEFSKWIAYQYDNASKVTDIQYPTGNHAVYKYDSLGRPTEIDYGFPPATKYAVLAYDTFGRLDSIYYWSGATNTTLQEKYTYDARDRATQVKVFSPSQTYMQLDYAYNKASEIRWSTDNMYISDDLLTDGANNPKNVTYAYDGNGRLAFSSGPYGSTQQSTQYNCYDYDAVGNIAHWKQGTASCPTSGTGYYTYNPTGWNEVSSITNLATSFTYNSAGSMLTKVEGSTTTYTQDFLEQLVKVVSGSNTYTYVYDGLGRRIKTIDPTQTLYFMYSGSKMMYSRVGTSGTETDYVYVGNRLLLRRDGPSAYVRYYHDDISPSNVRLITFYDTAVRDDAKYRYKPFGDILILKGSTQRFQYAQQEYDGPTTRQYHMGLRYQDPVVGRFAQRDPIGPGYSYAGNNPISLRDPTGETATLISPDKTKMAIATVALVVALTIIAPEADLVLILVMGLLVGAIFVAGEAVLSGGHATANEYIEAFTWGFMVGTVIGAGVARAFALRGAARLAASKVSLPMTERQAGAGLLAENNAIATPSLAGARLAPEFRLTSEDLEAMERELQESGYSGAAFVKESGSVVRRWVPERAGNFELNRVAGVGYWAKLGEVPEPFAAFTDFDRNAIALFDQSIRLNAEALEIPYQEGLVRTVLHELTHASRGFVSLDDPFEEAIADASSLGFPVPLG